VTHLFQNVINTIVPNKFITRKLLSFRYIRSGKGIEIGPSFLPLPLKKSCSVTYIDIITPNEYKKIKPELIDKHLIKIDIIDDCEKLTKIADNSLDFIIANHVIEHLINPIETIKIFNSKLLVGGLIFLAIPDKRFTFDKSRNLTSFSHLKSIYQKGFDDQIDKHYIECAKTYPKLTNQEVKRKAKELKLSNQSIHYHTFQKENFLQIVSYLENIGIPVRLVNLTNSHPNTGEFIVILKKF
jgi:predicted SAM-dependent methyltransferase